NHPWLVIALSLLTCGVCLHANFTHLKYQTHRSDLISPHKDYFQRWQQYVAEFGDDDDIVVVVQGKNRALMEEALEELASEVQNHPELFDRLFYKLDLRPLHDRALLFLPTSQIRQIQDNIRSMGKLLEPPAIAHLDPMLGWKSLSLLQLLQE